MSCCVLVLQNKKLGTFWGVFSYAAMTFHSNLTRTPCILPTKRPGRMDPPISSISFAKGTPQGRTKDGTRWVAGYIKYNLSSCAGRCPVMMLLAGPNKPVFQMEAHGENGEISHISDGCDWVVFHLFKWSYNSIRVALSAEDNPYFEHHDNPVAFNPCDVKIGSSVDELTPDSFRKSCRNL